MPTVSIGPYDFAPRDRVENFHGNQLVHLLWEKHLMFASPITVPLPPPMPFAAVIASCCRLCTGNIPTSPRSTGARWNGNSTAQRSLLIGARRSPRRGSGTSRCCAFRTPGLNGLAGAAF